MKILNHFIRSVACNQTACLRCKTTADLVTPLVPNSTRRTPAMDMWYLTPPTDKLTTIVQLVVQQICHIPTSRHVKMLEFGKFLSAGGEFVIEQVVELL